MREMVRELEAYRKAGGFVPMTRQEIIAMRIIPVVPPAQTPAPAPTPDPKKAESETLGRAMRARPADDRRMGAAHWMGGAE